MNSLRAIFLKGLATLLPLLLTAYALYWAVVNIEALLGPLLPAAFYFPGSGLLLGILFIGLFGMLMHFFLFEWLVGLGSEVLNRIPIVKSLYRALQDFFSYLGQRSNKDLSRVVLVSMPGDCRLVGFTTSATAVKAASPRQTDAEYVSVYLPLSYQIGGYMVLVPAERVAPLDLSVEDAMRVVLTAGVGDPTAAGSGGPAVRRSPGV